MTIAQGIKKITVVKKQSGLGLAASGSGGQILRRESSANNLTKDTYGNNEIVQHQQGTGITHGLRKVAADLKGILSPGTYSTLMASILRKDFTATAAITGASITIAGTGPSYTVTRAAGSFLTDGIKIGDVVRLSVGSLNAANINKNMLVTNVVALVLTVVVINRSALVAEGPITGTTITVPGKKSLVPLTGHTSDYWTVEDWQSDISQSETFTDVVFGAMDIGLPSTGNATIGISGPGLNRTIGGAQILTSPTAETTTNPLAAVNGMLIVNGSVAANVTGVSIKVDGKAAAMGAVVGSNVSPDVQRGRVDVTGQFTALYQDATISTLFDNATDLSLVCVITDSALAAADFITISMSAITLSGDSKDDGEKGTIRTYPFTAKINAAGGAALANDQTIITIQDSQA